MKHSQVCHHLQLASNQLHHGGRCQKHESAPPSPRSLLRKVYLAWSSLCHRKIVLHLSQQAGFMLHGPPPSDIFSVHVGSGRSNVTYFALACFGIQLLPCCAKARRGLYSRTSCPTMCTLRLVEVCASPASSHKQKWLLQTARHAMCYSMYL